jgi:hypothetical protein
VAVAELWQYIRSGGFKRITAIKNALIRQLKPVVIGKMTDQPDSGEFCHSHVWLCNDTSVVMGYDLLQAGKLTC